MNTFVSLLKIDIGRLYFSTLADFITLDHQILLAHIPVFTTGVRIYSHAVTVPPTGNNPTSPVFQKRSTPPNYLQSLNIYSAPMPRDILFLLRFINIQISPPINSIT